jgi:hypothetical protein
MVIIMRKVYVWFNNGYEEETGYRYAIEPTTVKKGYTYIGVLTNEYEFIKAENAPAKMVAYFTNMMGLSC